jgi:hypothetical protein
MGLIDLYPDNEQRARRVQELSDDCNLYFNELNDVGGEIQASVDQYVAKAKEMLLALKVAPDDPRLRPKAIDIGPGFLAECLEYGFDFLTGFLTQQAVQTALLIRMAKNLDSIPLKQGGSLAGRTITRQVGSEVEYAGAQGLEKIAIKELKFPKWIRFKSFAGGAGAAVVITLAIDVIVDAFVGASTRAKLREAIKGLYGPRRRIKAVLVTNKALLRLINTTIGSMDDMKALGYTQEQLDKLMQLKAAQVQAAVADKTAYAKAAADALETLDKDRGSFRDDDVMDEPNAT